MTVKVLNTYTRTIELLLDLSQILLIIWKKIFADPSWEIAIHFVLPVYNNFVAISSSYLPGTFDDL